MTEEKTKPETIDYQARLDNLKEDSEYERSDWLKTPEGQHRIKFLSEGTPYEAEYEGEVRKKLRFDVEFKGKKYSWGIGEGITKRSLYGQLLKVATETAPKNQLTGKTITLLVTGSGKKRSYTVLEAAMPGFSVTEINPAEAK